MLYLKLLIELMVLLLLSDSQHFFLISLCVHFFSGAQMLKLYLIIQILETVEDHTMLA